MLTVRSQKQCRGENLVFRYVMHWRQGVDEIEVFGDVRISIIARPSFPYECGTNEYNNRLENDDEPIVNLEN